MRGVFRSDVAWVCRSDVSRDRTTNPDISEIATYLAPASRQTCLPDTADLRAQPGQLLLDILVATIEVVDAVDEIGRASCRARVCQYVLISVVAGTLKKKR